MLMEPFGEFCLFGSDFGEFWGLELQSVWWWVVICAVRASDHDQRSRPTAETRLQPAVEPEPLCSAGAVLE